MKRRLLALLLTGIALSLNAQQPKHELIWSFGLGDEPHLKSVRNNYVKQFQLEDDASLFSSFQNINSSLNMEYIYHLNKRWAVGADISYTEAAAKGAHRPLTEEEKDNPFRLIFEGLFYSIFPNDELKLSSKAWTVMPEVHYKWLENRNFTLYSKVGMGISYYQLKSKSSNFPNIKENKMRLAYQLSPVGIELGSHRLRFTSELGYGLQGIWNIGLAYYIGKGN